MNLITGRSTIKGKSQLLKIELSNLASLTGTLLKKTLLLFATLAIILDCSSQINLLGTSTGDIRGKNQSLFSFNSTAKRISNEYRFEQIDGSRATRSNLASVGTKLFGTTAYGGDFNDGVIFQFDTLSKEYEILHHFDGTNSMSYPNGEIYLHKNKIYGVGYHLTNWGDTRLFEYDLITESFTKIQVSALQDLDLNANFLPYAHDTVIATCYSTDNNSNEGGFLYFMDLNTKTVSKIIDFDTLPDYNNPMESLVLKGDSLIYGYCVKDRNGFSSTPVLFSLNLKTKRFTEEFFFRRGIGLPNFGEQPSDLEIHSDSILLGVFSKGGRSGEGTLFKFNSLTKQASLNVEFGNYRNTSKPRKITKAVDGSYYGFLGPGYSGSENYGAIYRYNLDSNKYEIIYELEDREGQAVSNMIEVNRGRLFGISGNGGVSGAGALLEYNYLNNELKHLLDFNSSVDGYYPAWLLEVNDTLVYGKTNSGGILNQGVIFSYNPLTGVYIKVIDPLSDSSLAIGLSKPMATRDNKLYAFRNVNRSDQPGGLVRIYPESDSMALVADLDKNGIKYSITSNILELKNGNLFFGVFSYQSSQSVVEFVQYDLVLDTFTFYSGPESGGENYSVRNNLIETTTGTILGITNSSMFEDGFFFEFDLNNSSTRVIQTFDFNARATPIAIFTMRNPNTILGFTGDYYTNTGRIFQYDVQLKQFKFIQNFDFNKDGHLYRESLVKASNNKIYGITSRGYEKPNDLFEYDFATNQITKLDSFPFTSSSTQFTLQELKYLPYVNPVDRQVKPFLYPNPIADFGTIVLDKFANHVTIEIFDVRGNKVQQQNYSQTRELTFRLRQNEGFYIVRITADGQLLKSLKVLKYKPEE